MNTAAKTSRAPPISTPRGTATPGAVGSAPRAHAVRARWQALAARERQSVLGAAALVGAALLWWALLAPALHTLREAPARHAQLDAQLEKMQRLAAEAQQLQADAANRPNQAQAQRALQAATTTLGASARVTIAGDRATVTLQGVPAESIAPWLAQVRGNARSVPVEVHLSRNTSPSVRPGPVAPIAGNVPPSAGFPPPAPAPLGAPPAVAAEARWDGRIVLALPAR